MAVLKIRNLGSVFFAISLIFNLFAIPCVSAHEKDDTREINPEEEAHVKQEVEAITVTAQKREENMQEVPLSISVLSGVQIEDAGIRKTEDFIHHIPNLYMGSPGSHNGSSWLNMRGISGIPADTSTNPAVGFYVDGVYYSGGFSTELVDIDRIEVLRGPQGTLYGRNTEAGVIHIITKKPGDHFEGKAAVTLGNYNTQDYSVSVSGPMIQDKVYFSLAGKYLVSDGYIDNRFTGNDKSNDMDDQNIRAGLRWTPTDTWDINFTTDFLRYRDGYDPFGPLNDIHTTSTDFKGNYDDQNAMGHNLKAEYTGSLFSLTSITSLRQWDEDLANDMDMSSTDLTRWYQELDFSTFSQEVRLASPEESGAVKWLVGSYYYNEDKSVDMIYDMRQGFPAWGLPPYKMLQDNDIDTSGYAFFGQATCTLFHRLDLTGGLRYDHTAKELKFKEYYDQDLSMFGMTPQNIKTDEEDYNEWLPKLALDYKWSPDFMTYISYAKGFKGGGFNIYSSSVAGTVYEPECSSNYEVGLKSSWLENRLTLNMAAFYIDWKDQQVFQFIGSSDMIISNAAESTSKGFEIELLARPVTGLELTAGFGYTNVEFDEYKKAEYDSDMTSPTYGQKTGERDLSGYTNSYVPEYTYDLAIQYRSLKGFFGRLELQGVGEYWFDGENSKKQDGYELVNARIGYETELFEVVLWGKNLFDKEYATLGIAPQMTTSGNQWTGAGGDPMTFGITLSKRF
ncbi:MAG: TonB-dependent receptor [Desulfobacteraceae bacterium]|nr:TonB-dependent receptor [Desulfobacteraceae bacterium]